MAGQSLPSGVNVVPHRESRWPELRAGSAFGYLRALAANFSIREEFKEDIGQTHRTAGTSKAYP
jgi:hypothetical protein